MVLFTLKKLLAILTILFLGNAAAFEAVKALDLNAQTQADALPCEDRGSCEDERKGSETCEECTAANHPGPPAALGKELSDGFSTESMNDRHILFTPLRPPSV